MSTLDPTFPTAALLVRPWPDPVIDQLGHDPRSSYVERFWLGILGPSTTWLLRRFASDLEANPSGYDLDLAETARALGLGGKGGRHSPFMRSIDRCCQFGAAQQLGDATLEVRRKLPPLTRSQVQRLPDALQREHKQWQEEQLPPNDVTQLRQRARRLALSLLELGEDVEAAERQLHRWRFHPALAREATEWAFDRHRNAAAAAAAQSADEPPPAA